MVKSVAKKRFFRAKVWKKFEEFLPLFLLAALTDHNFFLFSDHSLTSSLKLCRLTCQRNPACSYFTWFSDGEQMLDKSIDRSECFFYHNFFRIAPPSLFQLWKLRECLREVPILPHRKSKGEFLSVAGIVVKAAGEDNRKSWATSTLLLPLPAHNSC